MRKILFLGQKWIGQACFDQLLLRQDQMTVCACVSNSSPAVWWKENRIWQSAREHSIHCIDNDQRNTHAILELIQANNIDTILSVQHPWILPKELINAVEGQAFNIHNAPLPTYQGHNACNHAILNAETQFCSTLHWMTDIVDAGAIAREEWFPILCEDTAWSLYHKGIAAAEKLFAFLLDSLINDVALPQKTINGPAIFYPRSSIETLRKVNDLTDTELVNRTVRAFYFPPFEPAYFVEQENKRHLFPTGVASYAH